MKIVTLIGARPQFIKAAVVSRAFREQCPEVREVLVHTGQHYGANMSAVFFEELDIPQPDYHLGIGGGTHGQNTALMTARPVLRAMDRDLIIPFSIPFHLIDFNIRKVQKHIKSALQLV